MGQQQTKEENTNFQNYRQNPNIQQVNKQPITNPNPGYNTNAPPQQINQGINPGVNIRPQQVPDYKPKYKGGISL
jgi:hypothetical protein